MIDISRLQMTFEPHAGFGSDTPDGEPFPFGYISTSQTPMPVFELNVLLDIDPEQLRRVAEGMAAWADMLATLRKLVALNDNAGPFGGEMLQDRIDRAWDEARAIIARAEGGAE